MQETQKGYSVQDTAVWIAAMRAAESKRSNRFFNDHLAHKLVKQSGLQDRIAKDFPPESVNVSVRTKIIDDFLMAAIHEQGIERIICLGAGLDTRAYRLDLDSSLEWVDVDLSEILLFKKTVLRDERPKCKAEHFVCDLSTFSGLKALSAKLDSSAKKTLVLSEALFLFLDKEQVAKLCLLIAQSHCTKAVITEYCSDTFVALIREKTASLMSEKRPTFRFGVPVCQGASYFAQFGWPEAATKYVTEEAILLRRLDEGAQDKKATAVSLFILGS